MCWADEEANRSIAENTFRLEQEEYDRLRRGEPPSNPHRGLGRWLLARFRLSPLVVCQMSYGMGLDDYHDYPDTKDGYPDHFSVLRCARCDKSFTI